MWEDGLMRRVQVGYEREGGRETMGEGRESRGGGGGGGYLERFNKVCIMLQ